MKRHILSAVLLTGAMLAMPAMAQSAGDTYKNLQTAVAMKAKCSGKTFSQAEYLLLEQAVEAKAGGLLGAGVSLTAIEAAKAKAAGTLCSSDAGKEMVALFDSTLAPALK